MEALRGATYCYENELRLLGTIATRRVSEGLAGNPSLTRRVTKQGQLLLEALGSGGVALVAHFGIDLSLGFWRWRSFRCIDDLVSSFTAPDLNRK
jgi:hypothetical protein